MGMTLKINFSRSSLASGVSDNRNLITPWTKYEELDSPGCTLEVITINFFLDFSCPKGLANEKGLIDSPPSNCEVSAAGGPLFEF